MNVVPEMEGGMDYEDTREFEIHIQADMGPLDTFGGSIELRQATSALTAPRKSWSAREFLA